MVLTVDTTSHVLPTAVKPDLVMVRGEGSYLFDDRGRRYLDFVQGWAVNALGHCAPSLRDALSEQASELWHASPAFHNRRQIELCDALASASGLQHVFLCTTGAEANESAVKLVRKWGSLHRGGAFGIVTTHDGFHGRTLATMSASGKREFDALFEPKVCGFRKVPFGDAEAVARAVDDTIAAILVEPIQGEAGVVMPPEGYLRSLRAIADAAGVLLVFDEVQTGLGRTGHLFAFQREQAVPDIMTLGKGLGAGLPLAAMLCRGEVSCFAPGDQGGTHVGNALLAAVGAAVVRIVGDPGFLASVRARGARIEQTLRALGTPWGAEERGDGLLRALVLPEPVAQAVAARCLQAGLLLNAPRPTVLRFMPALNVTDEEISEMGEILSKELTRCLSPRPPVTATGNGGVGSARIG